MRLSNFSVSMLLPLAFDPSWTQLSDGVFNDYGPGSTPDEQAALNWQQDASFGQSLPIPLTANTLVALVAQNTNRAFLIIQNNSTATSPDTAPTLYVAYDGPVPTPLVTNLAIPAGAGIVLDRRVPYNAIYVKWGSYTNTGGSAVVGGVLQQGLLTPASSQD
jgi:hypothetical protein